MNFYRATLVSYYKLSRFAFAVKRTQFAAYAASVDIWRKREIFDCVFVLLNEAQDLNELDAMYVTGQQKDTRVYVLESDITNAQNNRKVRVTESTF